MKDFRNQVVQRPLDHSAVIDLLRQGHLAKALRKARTAGISISQSEIDSTARTLFDAGRAGELLAMIEKVEVNLPYDKEALLIRAFSAGDYHTFLKQAYRLNASRGIEGRIREAIEAVELRAPLEASAWRRKFADRE